MDSLTQAALGAAIGEVTLGRKIGNKAILWGAVIATLPDLDVIANPLFDNIDKLGWHRGVSHSVTAVLILTPLFGWLMKKVHKQRVTFKQGMLLASLAVSTHILLNCLTMYGTQVFAPFSDYKVAWNSVFIIDLFYTIPLIAGVIAALWLKRENEKRRKRVWFGLSISSGYLLLGLIIKIFIDLSAFDALKTHEIEYKRFMSSPAPFSPILWRVVAESEKGYHVGYISVFDSKPTSFQFVARNDSLLDGIRSTRAVQKLLWFSDGYYSVSKKNGTLGFHDIRFGEFATTLDGSNFGLGPWGSVKFLFTFNIFLDSSERYTFERAIAGFENTSKAFGELLQRMKGI